MAKTSFMQNSFLAGEFSPFSQGRSDTPEYYQGMNLCLNYVLTDEGAITRRGGLRFSAEARANAVRMVPFNTAGGNSYICELTNTVMRFHTIGVLVDDIPRARVRSISSATPAVVETFSAHGWSTGDTVIFSKLGVDFGPHLYNRQFRITVLTSTTFSIAHTGSLGTGSVSGSGFDGLLAITEEVGRVTEVTTPYGAAQLGDIKYTEEADNLYLFHSSHEPNVLDGGTLALTEADFLDGPYLDQNTTATTLAFSGTTGSVTVTASASLFTVATDVGRLIRVNTGTEIAPDWSWLEITAVASTTSATATIRGENLASGSATTLWRLGVFSNTTGWPTHGVVHDGRLWLINDAFVGRVDGSVPFDFFNFSPSSQDGTVGDGNSVSVIAAGRGRKNFRWLVSTDDGLLAGADSGEWLVHASALNDPLTPFTTQIHRQTKYGSADVLPVEGGSSTLFVQSLERALMEYKKEGGRYDGNDIARRARHLTPQGLEELAYSQVPSPVIWARRSDQRLIGVTYRNDLEGKQAGWHQHNVAWADDPFDAAELAKGRHKYVNDTGPLLSIAVAPFSDSEATRNDTLWGAVLRNGQACIEYLTPVFDDTKDPNEAFHVDSGNTYRQEDLGITWKLLSGNTYRFYGLDRLVGDTVDMTFRGVDMGSGVVQVGGYVDLTLNSVLDSVASAYETASRSSIIEGGLSFLSGFISEHRTNDPSRLGYPCPQSAIIVGEDGNRYYVEGGTGGTGGDFGTLYVYNADTGASADTKTDAELHSEASAGGVDPLPDKGTSNSGSLAITIPETPYIYIITGAAGGVDSHKLVLLYKMNASGLLEFVGGVSLGGDGLNVQYSPPEAYGSAALAAGWVAAGSGDPGTYSSYQYRFPVAVAWHGESRSTIVVLPSINWMIGNTPVNISNATDPWFAKELQLNSAGYGANIFNLQDSPNVQGKGFFLPLNSGSGSLFCMMFHRGDLDAHVAGTESVSNTYIDTYAPLYPTGLISAIRLSTAEDFSTAVAASGSFGDSQVDFHSRFLNADGTAAFPFPDDGLDYDGSAGSVQDNYYCNPTVYPSDEADPTKPWFMFFYRAYRASGDTDKGGIRVFKWDPISMVATYLDFQRGQIFELGVDVNADTEILQGNVQWNRDTGALTLLLRGDGSGAKSLIVTEFGSFDPVTATITVVADAHIDAVIGLNYYSRGQLLRPEANSGARNGASLGKQRRTDRFNGLFYRTGQIKFGTKFTDLISLVLEPPDSIGRRPLSSKVSEIRGLQDSYTYDSMMAFEQDRPDPGGIVALAGHVTTQDL